MVAAQYAATVKNSSPSPRDKNKTDWYGSRTAAPAQINPAAHSGPLKPMPQRPIRLPNRRLKESDNQPPSGAATALTTNGKVLYQPPLTSEKPRTLTRYR